MKKYIALSALSIVLTGCFGASVKPPVTKEPPHEPATTLEERQAASGSTTVTNTGTTQVTSTGVSTGTGTDKETEETLKEIDKIIDDVSNEK